MRFKYFIRRFLDRDKLAYLMVIAFGVSLLMITAQFQFGRTTLLITPEESDNFPQFQVELGTGYITEENQSVRIVEGILGLGLVGLGVERMINRKRKQKEKENEN